MTAAECNERLHYLHRVDKHLRSPGVDPWPWPANRLIMTARYQIINMYNEGVSNK